MHANELSEANRIRDHHTELFRTERSCLADLLVSIGDFEHRGLHRVLGVRHHLPSTSIARSRCRREWPSTGWSGLGWCAGFRRWKSRYGDGRLCLTTIIEVARVMTVENRADWCCPGSTDSPARRRRRSRRRSTRRRWFRRRTIVSFVGPDAASGLAKGSTDESGSIVELASTRPEGGGPRCEKRAERVRSRTEHRRPADRLGEPASRHREPRVPHRPGEGQGRRVAPEPGSDR